MASDGRSSAPGVRTAVLVVAAVLVVVAVAAALQSRGSQPGSDEAPVEADVERPATLSLSDREPLSENEAERTAGEAVARFIDVHVDGDGRIERHENDDTVAEAQAYAMLMTAATYDEGGFWQVWDWTDDNLRREDGLFANLWRDGAIEDPDPAADANLHIAHALHLAGERFDSDELLGEARDVAYAIGGNEIVEVDGGTLLAAGPWAVEEPPYEFNPSYLSPRALRELSEITPDLPWNEVRLTGYDLIERLTESGPHLPPDWVLVQPDGTAEPSAAPDAEGDPHYGFEAVRVPLFHAADCDERGRQIAARTWPFLREEIEERGLVTIYSLDGRPVEGGAHPAAYVGAAGAARAAGDRGAVAALLEHAEELDRQDPTYYGSALIALGRILLTTDLLGPC